MPVYHTQYIGSNSRLVGNLAVLPLKGVKGGVAPAFMGNEEDIIDESISLFRANCLFKNFEIKGPEDRVLIYLTLFIQECLLKLQSKAGNINEANKYLNSLAVGNFAVPGEAGFPLNSLYESGKSRNDIDTMRQYLSQLRQETASRLVTRVYYEGTDKPSKWWVCFAKRKFMGIAGISGA